MSFPPATEMFQFAGFASHGYIFTMRYRRSGGLPHSEILGSKLTGSSPRLNAACHVLHRLSMPRHPPNALQTLDHTQPHAGSRGPEVRDQIPDDPNNLGTLQRPAYEIRSIHNGSWILFKSWRGLVTRTSTEQHQTTEQTEHAIVRRLVSKEDRPCPGAVNRARQGTFFTSSSQCQRTQTQSSELRVQVSD